jgi:hypothetical protein
MHLGLPVLASLILGASQVRADAIDPFYASNYTLTNLGAVPGLPGNYGGLTFFAGNPNIVLIGGNAGGGGAQIFAVGVTRDAQNHITGFTGPATFFANAPGAAGGGLDGGLSYGPGGVLFYTTFSDNTLGQIKPGSTGPDKLTSLTPLGVTSSTGGLGFVPAGIGGAGQLKLGSYSSGGIYDATLTPDGTGTFNVTVNPPGPRATVTSPEGMQYINAGAPLFTNNSVLISEFDLDRVSSFEVDANGDPIVGTRRSFITGVNNGAEGITRDPLTGDLLMSVFSNPHVNLVTVSVPEPSSFLLAGLSAGMIGVMGWRRRSGRSTSVVAISQ